MEQDALTGPIDLAVVEFPGSRFNGQIVPALAELVDSGTVTILDLVVVTKGDDDSLDVAEITAIPDVFDDLDGSAGGLLGEDDFEMIGAALSAGSSALVVVWQNTWTNRLRDAIAGSGGRLVAHDRLDTDTVLATLAEADA